MGTCCGISVTIENNDDNGDDASEIYLVETSVDEDVKQLQKLQDQAFEALLRDKPLRIDEVYHTYATNQDKTKMDINGLIQAFAYFGMVINGDLSQWVFESMQLISYGENEQDVELDFDDFNRTMTYTFKNIFFNESNIQVMFAIFDIDQDGELNIQDFSRLLLAQNYITVSIQEYEYNKHDYEDAPMPYYTKKESVKLAKKLMMEFDSDRFNDDKILILSYEFGEMMKILDEKGAADILNVMCLQFIIPNSNTSINKQEDEKKDEIKIETSTNISKINFDGTVEIYEPQKRTSRQKKTVSEHFIEQDDEHFISTKKNKTIKKMGYGDKTRYGLTVIKYDGKGIHRWKIKIIKLKSGECIIGIDEESRMSVEKTFYMNKDSIHYGYWAKNGKKINEKGKFKAFDSKYKTGDIVEMVLNLNNKKLGFGLNGSEIKYAFDVSSVSVGYCLAVCLCNDGDAVTLESYKHSHSDIIIKIKFTCEGQKDVENDKIVVAASYIDDYVMNNIFKCVEKYLNNKYYPLVFTVEEMINATDSLHIFRRDIGNDSIRKYDLHSLKQNGLHIKLTWIYMIEIDNQKIDCAKMIQLKSSDPLECDIYCKMLKQNEFTVDNLRHLENDIHFVDPNSEKPQCKYGDECKIFIRMEQNSKNCVEDECHMILYRHPPRTRTIKMSENIHSLVLKTNSQECEPIYNPDKHDYDIDYTASLLSEVIDNGYRFDLCLECGKDEECKHGYLCLKCGKKDKCDHSKFGIFEIVKQKMNCKRYKQLSLNFKVGHMLALVLYTGCECNYDLCKSQRNGDYKKWKWFDYFLWNAIQMISEKENGKYPVFTGLTSVQIEEQIMKAGYFATYVSTSSQEWIANEFLKGEGMLIRIDPQFRNSDFIKCCDVSWISKFPDESETLFARSVEHGSEDVFRLEVIDMIEGKQIVSLKEIDYDELANGNLGSLSQMVDIALAL